MDLQNSSAAQAVIAIIAFLAYILPLLGIFWAFKWADKGLHGVARGMQGVFRKAGRKGSSLAKRGVVGSAPAQAAKQFMAQRRSIAGVRGRDQLRDVLNKNPRLKRIMGGPGGEAYAARFLDTENRKHEAQQIEDLSKGMTLGMANAMSQKQSLTKALSDGHWVDKNGRPTKPLSDEDTAGIQRLVSQGYVDKDGRIPSGNSQSYIAASAALSQIYESDDVTAEKLQGLGSLLKGTDSETNAKFTEMNRALAVNKKSKNVAFAAFNDGVMDQFANKKPAGLMSSGLNGVNKDALKYSNHDLQSADNPEGKNMYLTQLRKQAVGSNGARNYAEIVERTRQTLDQDHDEVIEGLSYAMGFGDINPESLPSKENRTEAQKAQIKTQVDKLNQLRLSLRTSTAAPPPEFADVLGKEPPAAGGGNSGGSWPPPDRPNGPNPYM